MSNQQTPMQEAIEKLKEAQKSIFPCDKYADVYFEALVDTIRVLTDLLLKEQQVIEDAFIGGTAFKEKYFKYIEEGIGIKEPDYESYYNTKFK